MTDRRMRLARALKRGLIHSGIPPLRRLEFLIALFELGRWRRANPAPTHLATREALYAHVAGLLGDAPLDFIEAGVYRGESFRRWVELSPHPDSRFFGFDTFTGLPTPWRTGAKTFPAGSFDAGGAPPAIADPRVRFFAGRFQETLPVFLRDYQRRGTLVVHCDADLYPSTLYFLAQLDAVMAAGDYLLFDNFSVATHDFRAFRDYSGAYLRRFTVIADAETDGEKIALRRQ